MHPGKLAKDAPERNRDSLLASAGTAVGPATWHVTAPTPLLPSRKLDTSGTEDRVQDGDPLMVQPSMHMDIAPVMPTGGYRLPAKIDSVDVRMLLDTGAAVTLLRHDIWLQIASRSPRSLKPWPMAVLVSAGGNPLTINGCADITLGVGEEISREKWWW